jgi:hypothetical protein
MIVYTSMNEEEIREEVLKDLRNVFSFVQKNKLPKFKRIVIKTQRFPVTAHAEFVSPQKNRWLALFVARHKKEVRYMLVCLYDSPHGRYAVSAGFGDYTAGLLFYAPHFFGRYAKRVGLDLSGTPLVRHFFENNRNCNCDTPNSLASSSHTKREIIATSAEGVCMGHITDCGNIMFCTFITYEMAQGEQVWQFAHNEVMRNEMFTLHDAY